jgi:hypothetical protein
MYPQLFTGKLIRSGPIKDQLDNDVSTGTSDEFLINLRWASIRANSSRARNLALDEMYAPGLARIS